MTALHSLQVQEQTSVTAGGLMLPDTARERPMSGKIVRVGPGKRDKDGSRKPTKVGPVMLLLEMHQCTPCNDDSRLAQLLIQDLEL